MATAASSKKVMEIVTPLGADDLLFQQMDVTEELGRLATYHISVLSKKNDIDPDKLLGKNVTVKLELPKEGPRCFDAYVTRFGLVGSHQSFYRYQIVARPWLWLLTRTTDCRIFQNEKIEDIIKKIFEKYPAAKFDFKLSGNYEPWVNCVQYRETDFNFVSRLMEQEGMYYYFQHDQGQHTMVITDSMSGHKPFKGYDTIEFVPQERQQRFDREFVSDWNFTREIEPGAYVVDDYDFEKPSTELQVNAKLQREHAQAEGEYYDYPGEYTDRSEGEHYVKVRLEELQAQHELANGSTNARGLACGCLFKLKGHARKDQDREYLVVSAHHSLSYNEYEAMGGQGAQYSCNFTVLHSKEVFRPQRLTPKPIVQGPQTAVVVGPKGDEIYTDKYGRVKVQFHWDRYGKKDENSSCWIRVSHPWAGKNWGMVAIPRIGQEVIVDFLEGDPDWPIISGRVYNAEQMPPYDLPANKTQTGAKSRSSQSGTPANFNEIRFEDKKGSEQVYIHAEKNQDIVVENDETHSVGHDRTKSIGHDETTTVAHDRTETVGNNETITIGVNRTEMVGANESITIGANRTEMVGANETITIAANRIEAVGAAESVTIAAARAHTIGGADALTVGGARAHTIGAAEAITIGAAQTIQVAQDQSTSVGGAMSTDVGKAESRSVGEARTTNIGKDDSLKVGKNLVIDAGDSVTIKTGDASISMKKDGTIVIKGKNITIQGSGKINVKADSDVVIKGSKVGIN